MKQLATIVLAGGRGTRMHSATSKMLQPILGRPLVYFPAARAMTVVDGPVVVVSGDALDEIRRALQPLFPPERVRFAHQQQPLGTADAVKAGVAALEDFDDGQHVLILNGDVPGTTEVQLRRFLKRHVSRGADVTVLGFKPPDPFGYGRVLYDDSGVVEAIREQKELAPEEESLSVCNAGIYLARLGYLRAFLGQVEKSPNQREYLLTDLVSFVVGEEGGKAEVWVVPDPDEVEGVNTRHELASVTRRIRQERNRDLMLAGVGMPHPESVDVDFGVAVGPDTLIEANVIVRGASSIGSGCTIGTGSVIEDTTVADDVRVQPYCVLESSVIASGCNLGPFAHTRPGTVLEEKAKVGNFVETKKAVIGAGSKASHLSYLGDAVIGKGVNIGAGTITCNYDGYNKFKTVLEDGVFVGSDTQFVAPVTVGRDAVVAAGTTVTADVPAEALVISRVDQAIRPGYATQRKAAKSKKT